MISEPTSAKIDFKPEVYHSLLLKTRKSISELVNEAISLYFAENRDKNNGSALANEARRQSLLVSKYVASSEEIWEANIDDTEWTSCRTIF